MTVELMLHQIAKQTRRDRQLRQRQARARDAMHRCADALDLTMARRHPGIDRFRPGDAVADHLGGQAALRFADRIERTVKRKAVEIVSYLDPTRRIGDAIEL